MKGTSLNVSLYCNYSILVVERSVFKQENRANSTQNRAMRNLSVSAAATYRRRQNAMSIATIR